MQCTPSPAAAALLRNAPQYCLHKQLGRAYLVARLPIKELLEKVTRRLPIKVH